MKEDEFNSDGRPPKRKLLRHFDDEMKYLLSGEEQLLQSLTAHAPLTEVLNRICSALDRKIGNVVSHIALPEEDYGDPVAMGMNAALFGLYVFSLEALVAENDQLLGSLEIYCCVSRSPTADETRWIERAKCLAALAIQIDAEAAGQEHPDRRRQQPLQRRVRDWPALIN